MGRRIRQRTIYAATAMAVVTLIAGFALATITNFNVTTQSQGAGSVSTTGTNYQCATTCLTATIISGSTAQTCATSPTQAVVSAPSPPAVSIQIYVSYNGVSTCQGGDFAEEFSFTSAFTVGSAAGGCFVAGCSDTFLVSTVVGTTAYNSQVGTASFVESATPFSGSVSVDVQVFVDYQSSINPGVASVGIVVNGNY